MTTDKKFYPGEILTEPQRELVNKFAQKISSLPLAEAKKHFKMSEKELLAKFDTFKIDGQTWVKISN